VAVSSLKPKAKGLIIKTLGALCGIIVTFKIADSKGKFKSCGYRSDEIEFFQLIYN
jgi:hypothetical protein